MNIIARTFLLLSVGTTLAGCATYDPYGHPGHRNAVTGAAIGAVGGAVVGHAIDHSARGALVGGALGAVAGGAVGHSMDQRQDNSYSGHRRKPYRDSKHRRYYRDDDY